MTVEASWGGLQVRVSQPEITGFLETVGTVVEYSTTALEIGLRILEVVSSFTPGNLNLIRPLVRELIQSVKNLSADLQSLGVYAHLGDAELLSGRNTLNQLKGGYAAYERRMVTRLRDQRDLRKPNFSSSTSVVALFLYTGVSLEFARGAVDPQQLQPLRQFLGAFRRLLGVPGNPGGRNRGLPMAAEVSVRYPFGARNEENDPATSLARAYSDIMGRSSAILTWKSGPAPGAPEGETSPAIPPGGWLVEVSCEPGGYRVGYLSPTPSSTGLPGASSPDSAYTAGTYSEGESGQPLVVWGGVDSFPLPNELSWSENFQGDRVREGGTPVFFYRDPSVSETLKKPYDLRDGRYYNQRSFLVPRSSLAAQALQGGTFHLELTREQLPLRTPYLPSGELDYEHAQIPQTVYARVTAVGPEVTAAGQLQWDVRGVHSPSDAQVRLRAPYGEDSHGTPSEALPVVFPSPQEDQYGIALRVALAVMILTRSDLAPPDPLSSGSPVSSWGDWQATGLETVARATIGWLWDNPTGYFIRRGSSPDSFVQDLFQRISSLADQYTRNRGEIPAPAMAALQPQMELLLGWRWSAGLPSGTRAPALEVTVLESLVSPRSNPGTTPLARNVYSLPGWWANQGSRTPPAVLEGARDSYSVGSPGYGLGVFYEGLPVLYEPSTRRVWYPRKVVPTNIYRAARAVLELTADTSLPPRGWVAWRPLSGVSTLSVNTAALRHVEQFLQGVLQGLGAVGDALERMVNFLEQRIREMQELLLRIQSYLDLPFQVSIPDVVALPMVVNGTEGMIEGLQKAANKPTEGPGAYGVGIVVCAGGMPALLSDLLVFFLGG